MRWLLRFFQAADPMPPWLLALTLTVSAYTTAIIVADPRSVDEALAMLLLVQLLAAPVGFARIAATGCFDPALVRYNRGVTAAVHAVHATWPLATAWCGVALLELILYGSAHALETGRLTAFVFVSVVCWGLSLPGPRFAAGMLWLLIIVLSVTTRVGADQYAAMLSRPDGTAMELAHASLLVLVCPFLMVGDHIPPRAGVTLVLLAAAFFAGTVAIWYVARRDYPLEASS